LLFSAVGLYFFGLSSPYAPTNGDEMVYIHIARLTAASGHWLPLVSDLENMRNTKPPLLFWQAIASGDWSAQGSLFSLRWPSVAYTLLTTAALAWMTLRISGQWRTALLAAIIFLAFFSTYRYSRVYLTSAPETFWLALPMWYLLWQQSARPEGALASASPPGRWSAPVYLLAGLVIGIGLLYKSFALLAPAAAALGCALYLSQGPARRHTFLRTAWGVGGCAVVAVRADGKQFWAMVAARELQPGSADILFTYTDVTAQQNLLRALVRAKEEAAAARAVSSVSGNSPGSSITATVRPMARRPSTTCRSKR
jgi:4-amino-4-deoxy-L-arabinose transferase-like glycosyltransferase